jgi:hypothetical protein
VSGLIRIFAIDMSTNVAVIPSYLYLFVVVDLQG